MRSSLIAVCILLLAGCTGVGQSNVVVAPTVTQEEDVLVRAPGGEFRLAIADSDEERVAGLSNRDSVPQDGLLFIIDPPSPVVIWMKDMRFAIDIVWLSEGRVITLYEQVQPQPGASDASLTRYKPDQVADRVIELPAGAAALYGIKEGTQLELLDLH